MLPQVDATEPFIYLLQCNFYNLKKYFIIEKNLNWYISKQDQIFFF